LPTSQLNALEAESLTRRHWQVLNTIAHGARTPEDLDAALAPFGSIAARRSGHRRQRRRPPHDDPDAGALRGEPRSRLRNIPGRGGVLLK
jgi:hypothetical protein